MGFILVSFLCVLILNKQVDIILTNFLLGCPEVYMSNAVIFYFYLYVVMLMVPVSIIHELIHGCTYMLFGGKVRYGFKIIYMYTQETSGRPIKRVKFLIILLSPLMVISLFSPLLGSVWGGMVFLLNLLGSSGDICMALSLCRRSPDSSIIDRQDGYDVIPNEYL